MKIRPAGVEDTARIAEINVKTWKSAYRGLIDDNFLNNRNITPQRCENWRQIIAAGQTIFLAAENDEGIVCGYLWGGKGRSKILPLEWEIFAFYVLPEFQGQGFGRALFAAFRQKIGHQPFYLYALKGNRKAEAFYLRQGARRAAEFDTQNEISGIVLNEAAFLFEA